MFNNKGGRKAIEAIKSEVGEGKDKLKNIRSALFATEGGAMGEELEEGEVKVRDTFFGN